MIDGHIESDGKKYINVSELKLIYELLIKMRPFLETEDDKKAFHLLAQKIYEMDYSAWIAESHLKEYYKKRFRELMSEEQITRS